MRPSFATLTVVRLRYPVRQDQGVDVPDYGGTPAEAIIRQCWYEPTSSQEVLDGRLAVRTGYLVDAPPGIDVVETDHLRIEGTEYEVDGRPEPVRSPTGVLNSTRITTKRWEG